MTDDLPAAILDIPRHFAYCGAPAGWAVGTPRATTPVSTENC
jgi:hypothetical protein